MVSIHITEEGD